MARNFNAAVAELTKISDQESAKADEQLATAQTWLTGLWESAKQQSVDCVPPPVKRQRVTRGRAKAVEGKVRLLAIAVAQCIRPHRSGHDHPLNHPLQHDQETLSLCNVEGAWFVTSALSDAGTAIE